jgi:YHS domain-containing protein
MTRDPVCGMKVDEQKAEAETEYQGEEYYFCSQDCKEEFDRNPELYAERKSGGAGGD